MRRRQRRRKHLMQANECGPMSKLRKGQKAKVIHLQNDNPALRRRLIDMGITEGVEVCIKKVAPLGDPIDIYVRGYELCLRKCDMENIKVEVLPE